MLQAEGSCKVDTQKASSKLIKQLVDCEIVVYVKESLKMSKCEFLTMNHLNEMYVSSLKEKGIETDVGSNHKKHIKELLLQNVPDIEIRQPKQRNQSHYVTSKKAVSNMVDSCITSDSDSCDMFSMWKIITI